MLAAGELKPNHREVLSSEQPNPSSLAGGKSCAQLAVEKCKVELCPLTAEPASNRSGSCWAGGGSQAPALMPDTELTSKSCSSWDTAGSGHCHQRDSKILQAERNSFLSTSG